MADRHRVTTDLGDIRPRAVLSKKKPLDPPERLVCVLCSRTYLQGAPRPDPTPGACRWCGQHDRPERKHR